jgi:hypothetical protein
MFLIGVQFIVTIQNTCSFGQQLLHDDLQLPNTLADFLQYLLSRISTCQRRFLVS